MKHRQTCSRVGGLPAAITSITLSFFSQRPIAVVAFLLTEQEIYGSLRGFVRKAAIRFCSQIRREGSVWHSQTVRTDHPALRSARRTRLSLSAFLSSFATQHRRCVEGIRYRPHLCMCQKYSYTLMASQGEGMLSTGKMLRDSMSEATAYATLTCGQSRARLPLAEPNQ